MVQTIGPAGYALPSGAKTITDAVNKKLRPEAYHQQQEGAEKDAASGHGNGHGEAEPLLTHYQVAQMAKLTICILFLAAFLWGTEALPLGATDILVGVMLYLFAILPINEISRAYMKDAVFSFSASWPWPWGWPKRAWTSASA